MIVDAWPIQLFDLRAASDAEYAALNDFSNRIRAERMPDDPPIPLDEDIQDWTHIPDFLGVVQWVIRHPDDGSIIAQANTEVLYTGSNQHIIWYGISVLPEFRRKGLARSLLVPVVETARQENRRLLLCFTTERVPVGAAFMQRLGASPGSVGHTNQLVMAELDQDLMERWRAQGVERNPGFRLGLWTGPYPEDQLEAIVRLQEVMNTEPRDQLELDDFHWTPDQLRQFEASMVAQGTERWTLYAVEQATGNLAGFTEVFWNANRPHLLYQGDTGVFPEYRNRSLGRRLKAEMIEKVLRERPQVQFIRTHNADSNAAMLKINHEMGFKPYLAETTWQVETQKVVEYLNGG